MCGTMEGGHAVGGMHGRGQCMVGGMHGRGVVGACWQRSMHGRGVHDRGHHEIRVVNVSVCNWSAFLLTLFFLSIPWTKLVIQGNAWDWLLLAFCFKILRSVGQTIKGILCL